MPTKFYARQCTNHAALGVEIVIESSDGNHRARMFVHVDHADRIALQIAKAASRTRVAIAKRDARIRRTP
jgi:hypothetical protein